MNIDTSRLTFYEKEDKVYRQGNGRKVILDHAYVLDAEVTAGLLTGGTLLSGVTSVIDGTSAKPQLIQWSADMAVEYIKEHVKEEIITSLDSPRYKEVIEEARTAHTKKKEKAGTKGTDMHALVEQYIMWCMNENEKGKPYFDPDMQAIAPFMDWAVANQVKFLAAEQVLYSDTHKIAGTADFICELNGKLTIGDLKTMPKLWSADPFIQTGAYSLMFNELTGQQPEQSIIVRMCDPEDERVKKYNSKPFDTYPRMAIEEDEDMFLTRLKSYRYNNNFKPS